MGSKVNRFKVDYINDETCVLLDTATDTEIVSANHDEHGWVGMELLDKTAEALNQIL